jgi:hypothetical protein
MINSLIHRFVVAASAALSIHITVAALAARIGSSIPPTGQKREPPVGIKEAGIMNYIGAKARLRVKYTHIPF